MSDQTPLDQAHQAMQQSPDDNLSPEVVELDGASYLLAFDREERLVDFVGAQAHHAALSGRVLAHMLAGQELGLGLNLDVAPSSILLPAPAMVWLVQMLEHAPDQVEEQPVSFEPPTGLPEALLTALDARLASTAGLAKTAYLVAATYQGGRRGHVLAIIDAVETAQNALAKAVSEALSFSAVEAGQLDVTFFASEDPVCALLERVGLRFDLPEPEAPEAEIIQIPGNDPDKPPILR